MRAKQLREMTDDELERALSERRQELFNLRFQSATRQLADVSQVGLARRQIARIKTLLRERDLVRAGEMTAVAVVAPPPPPAAPRRRASREQEPTTQAAAAEPDAASTETTAVAEAEGGDDGDEERA